METPPLRQAWRAFGWGLACSILMAAVTRGPIYRVRFEMGALDGDFIDDRWVQGVFVLLYLAVIAMSVPFLVSLPRSVWPWVIGAMALPIVLIAAVSWSVDRQRAAEQAAMLALGSGAAIVLGLRLGVRRVAIASMAGIQTVVVVGVLAVARGWSLSRDINGRWAGVFFNRNSFAAPAAIALVLVVATGISVARSKGRHRNLTLAGLAALSALDLLVLVNAQSVTPLFGIAVGLAVVGAAQFMGRWSRSTRSPRLVQAVAPIATVAIFWRAGLAMRESSSSFGRSPTLEGRTFIWRVVREFIDERPLAGWGLGAVWARPEIHYALLDHGGGYDVNEAHSGYYEMWLAGGVIALLALGACLLGALWVALGALDRLTSPWSAVPLFVVGYVVAVNMTESFVGANLLPWTLLLAVSAGALRDAGDPETGQESSIIR